MTNRATIYMQLKFNLLMKVLCKVRFMEVTVSGESMEPTLYHSDVIVITLLDQLPKHGDVLLFYDSDYLLVLHRVVRIENDIIFLKGDNSNEDDLLDIIPIDNIIGKMVCKADEFKWTLPKVCKEFAECFGLTKLIVTLCNGRLRDINLRSA